ncbi:hypothetical protein L2734_10920, partial [Parashewanella spongiae]
RASSGFQQFDIYNLILEILFLMQSVDYELKPKHGIVQTLASLNSWLTSAPKRFNLYCFIAYFIGIKFNARSENLGGLPPCWIV